MAASNLSRADRLIIAISGALFAVTVFLITDDRLFFRLDPLPHNMIIGEVLSVRNTVIRKLPNRFGWNPLFNASPVYDLDTLFTSQDSEVNLQFNDKSTLFIGPNSMVTIAASKGPPALSIEPGSPLVLNLGNQARTLFGKGSSIRVFAKGAGKMDVQVLRGSLKILSQNGSESQVDSDQAVEVGPESVGKIRSLLSSPQASKDSPSSLAAAPAGASSSLSKSDYPKTEPLPGPVVTRSEIYFELKDASQAAPVLPWKAVPGAVSYEVQLSKESDFTSSKTFKDIHGAQFKWTRKAIGNYFWRVRGIDASSGSGAYSRTSFLRVWGAPLPIPIGRNSATAPPPEPQKPAIPEGPAVPVASLPVYSFKPAVPRTPEPPISSEQAAVATDLYVQNFVQLAYRIGSWLVKYGSSLNPAVSASDFLDTVKEAVNNGEIRSVGEPPKGQSAEKDALYLVIQDRITIIRPRWPLWNDSMNFKIRIVAHEIFRKMGLQDEAYKLSAQVTLQDRVASRSIEFISKNESRCLAQSLYDEISTLPGVDRVLFMCFSGHLHAYYTGPSHGALSLTTNRFDPRYSSKDSDLEAAKEELRKHESWLKNNIQGFGPMVSKAAQASLVFGCELKTTGVGVVVTLVVP